MKPAVPAPPPLQLHIERIVLDGLPLSRAQAGQLRSALEQELARLLTEGSQQDWRGVAVPRLDAPALTVTAPVRPLELGRAIAHSVHASLVRER